MARTLVCGAVFSRPFFALLLLASAATAQDERRVTSPNGQIEFRLFIATQPDNNLSRLAYEVNYRGQPVLKTSFLGLDIEVQEPLLGENVGLTSSTSTKTPQYNSLLAKYMQNGSLGRLLDVEVRAYNDGVAFRYIIPPSTPLNEFVILEEATEFRFDEKLATEGGPEAWVAISEAKRGRYPSMRLIRSNRATDLTRLSSKFEAIAPLTCPWRIISIGANRTTILADLNR